MKSIVVFGATGYTGKLVVSALVEMGVKDVILAGRDAERLQRLSAQHGGLQTRVADVKRPETLITLLQGAHVIINAVGPFLRFGEPVVRAAVEQGVHFLDITAEQSYMARILRDYDSAAKAKRVVVVNAQGLEFAVGICAAGLLAESDSSIHTIDIFARVDNHSFSRGSSISSFEAMFQEQLVLSDGRIQPRGFSPFPRSLVMSDSGRREYAIPFPGAEALYLGRTYPQIRNATNNLVMPMGRAFGIMGILAMEPLLRAVMRPNMMAAMLRKIESGPEGPDETERLSQTFNILARGIGSGGAKGVLVSGGDAYGITGVIAALGAKLLAEGEPREVGVVSTSQAFGAEAFLRALEPWGVKMSRPDLRA